MREALVISGSGPYSDPWHRFPETSGRLAAIIGSLGCSVEVTEDVEGRLAQPGRFDMLVINTGNPSEARPAERIAAAAQGLSGYIAAGVRCRESMPALRH